MLLGAFEEVEGKVKVDFTRLILELKFKKILGGWEFYSSDDLSWESWSYHKISKKLAISQATDSYIDMQTSCYFYFRIRIKIIK